MPFSIEDVNAALAGLEIAPLAALQVTDAAGLLGQRYPHVDPNMPLVVLGCAAGDAVRLQPLLVQVYGGEHEVAFTGVERRACPLAELAASAGPGVLFVPPLTRPASYAALQDIVARLRAPDGCPWDRALTWDKLRPTLLEEAYELLSALDAGDVPKVLEEQGDLLLQIAMQGQIATEEGQFRFGDVIARIVEKLVRRHPHVFGEVEVSGTDEVLANWEAIKAAERAANGEKRSPLAGIPAGLPALAQAEAYLDRISRLRTVDAPAAPWEALAGLPEGEPLSPELLGDALFGIVAWARGRGVDAESALRGANARYAREAAD